MAQRSGRPAGVIFAGLGFPTSPGNAGGFFVSAAFAALAASFFGGILGILGFFLALATCAFMFERALQSGMAGDARVQSWALEFGTIGSSIHTFLAMGIAAFWPLVVIALISGHSAFLLEPVRPIVELIVRNPFRPPPVEPPAWALPALFAAGAWGAIALPVVVTAWSYFRTPHILNPIWIIVHLVKGGGAAFLAYLGVIVVAALPATVFILIRLEAEPHWFSRMVGWSLFAWTGTVLMRAAGLYYWLARDRWGWERAVREGEAE
jgi:hypothetical protein